MFKIHTHVDRTGFIWVNFDSSSSPIPWRELNEGTDQQPRLQDFDLDKYVYHRTWTTEGSYNWKLVGENYNEVSILLTRESEDFTYVETSVITANLVTRASSKSRISTATKLIPMPADSSTFRQIEMISDPKTSSTSAMEPLLTTSQIPLSICRHHTSSSCV